MADPPAPAIGSSASTTRHCMVDQQHHDRSDDRHEHTVDIEAGDPFSPDEAKQKAADDRPDNPQNDIEDHPFARLVDNFAGDEAGD